MLPVPNDNSDDDDDDDEDDDNEDDYDTLGLLISSAVVFVSQLGRRLSESTGDPRTSDSLSVSEIGSRSPAFQHCADQRDLWSIRRPTRFVFDFKLQFLVLGSLQPAKGIKKESNNNNNKYKSDICSAW